MKFAIGAKASAKPGLGSFNRAVCFVRAGLGAGLGAAAITTTIAACSSPSAVRDPEAEAKAARERAYVATIERFSAGDKEYNGFYNQFDFRSTMQNSAVQEAMLKRQADYYQWDSAKLQAETAKAAAEMNRETHIFCAFFTPDRRNDNLSDPKAIWRVFLDVGGKRYVARIRRLRKLLAELQALFPYQTRWTTPYLFTFPTPVSTVEGQRATLTITGPLGSRTVAFGAEHEPSL